MRYAYRTLFTQNITIPGLSLVQWMNMNNQYSSLASMGIQFEFLQSLSNPAMQNLSTTELARQLYMQNRLLEQNSMQLSAPKLPQQMRSTNSRSLDLVILLFSHGCIQLCVYWWLGGGRKCTHRFTCTT
jgi:hypothetical protein